MLPALRISASASEEPGVASKACRAQPEPRGHSSDHYISVPLARQDHVALARMGLDTGIDIRERTYDYDYDYTEQP